MKKIYILALVGVVALSSCDHFLREEPEDFMSAESETVDEALIEAEYKELIRLRYGLRMGVRVLSGFPEQMRPEEKLLK